MIVVLLLLMVMLVGVDDNIRSIRIGLLIMMMMMVIIEENGVEKNSDMNSNMVGRHMRHLPIIDTTMTIIILILNLIQMIIIK